MLQRAARLQYALLALVTFFAFTHFYLGAGNVRGDHQFSKPQTN
jgi:hypothetical protein